ncbi:MAG: hypothetical protein U0166_28505 [Acidobacteriota bacterium]
MPLPKPPKTFKDFSARFPKLGEAWELASSAGADGPLDAKTARLIKLGIAIGAMREGSIHSGVRKALASGISKDEDRAGRGARRGGLGSPRPSPCGAGCATSRRASSA